MKTLYIDCAMGAAGDMLMGALLELTEDREAFLDRMNKLMPEGVSVTASASEKCGVTGTHVSVKIHGEEEEACGHTHEHHHGHSHHHGHGHHHHHHSGLADIFAMIDAMEVSEHVKNNAKEVYKIIAKAESEVHGKEMNQIHFHEVGTLDAVADVVGNCILMEQIGPRRVIASPVHVGSGTVKCAHGILPVPAPATALILKGVPIYGGEIQSELCTPTGAALLKHFVHSFESLPPMTAEKVGYGMGSRDFAQRPNCVRVILGDDGKKEEVSSGCVAELAANIDDMTAEEIGFAAETLREAGALDVYCEHIIMKKSRPAVKLVCICMCEDREKFASLMLKHTTTIGVREYLCRRYTLNRHKEQRQTRWGPVEVKVSSGYGVTRTKAEFEDMAKIAREKGLSLREVEEEIYQ